MTSNGNKVNDGNKFSTPMPMIGLDMAGATLVCLVLMVCDIFSSIRQRKPWIPCRFFVLNSFSLTLLSVATKLPVDLTTSMPSAYDQLSKLCGTSLICISIGFFRLSIVDMNESELSSNLSSLTLIVLTVVVDVSLQISTGAIFLFKVQHVINLVLMLALLCVASCFRFKVCTYYFSEHFRKSLIHMPKNIHTLKRCYIHSYITNPQLMLSRFAPSATVGMLCIISCVVLLESVFQTLSLDRGTKEASDYKWSIWGVVWLQILTTVVGTSAVVFRSLTFARQMYSLLFMSLKRNTILECYSLFLLAQRNWTLYSRALNHSQILFQVFRALENILDSSLFLMRICADCVDKLILTTICEIGDRFAQAMMKSNIIAFSKNKRRDDDDDEMMVMLRKEFDEGLEGATSLSAPNFYSDYLLRKSIADMEMCINKHSSFPLHHLLKFLGKPAYGSMELLKQIGQSSDELLLLVCLVRIADSLVSSLQTASLVCALDQAFEIIVFIHERTKVISASINMKINFAKDIWMSRSIKNHWFQTCVIEHFKQGRCTNHFRDHVHETVHHKELLKVVSHELYDIISIIGEPRISNVIIGGTNEQIGELYDLIEQLFVALLHSFIEQLPGVIFNGLSEGVPTLEFQNNVTISMKLIARLKILEMEPSGFASGNIKSFMASHDAVEKDKESAGGTSFGSKNHADDNLVFPTTNDDDAGITEAV
ncbi:hypothetical protein Syun_031140 [Stephania yunnanensis]|uniref:Uncharacterized protein n=1 Tax=Stephania yunnanensis TaxID=152371 RepID=A0AAP0HE44_9MAGN